MSTSSSTTAAIRGMGRFGRLWGRGYELLLPSSSSSSSSSRIFRISGPGATPYLQNLVTSDLRWPPPPPRPEPLNDGSTLPGVPKRILKQQQQSSASSSSSSSPDETRKESEIALMQEEGPVVEFNPHFRATCFLDTKGRIVTDALLWKHDEQEYYLQVPDTNAAERLWPHLRQYILRRAKVTLTDVTDQMSAAVIFGTLQSTPPPFPGFMAALDPRHPSLGLHLWKLPLSDGVDSDNTNHSTASSSSSPSSLPSSAVSNTGTSTAPDLSTLLSQAFPALSLGNWELVRRLAGVAQGSELTGRTALECNQEHLQAVSFDKGCYLGQELTARHQHTGVVRKRIMPLLLLDTMTQIPQAWTVASQLQQGRAMKRFTAEELWQALPSRLPRLSVWMASNLVAATTGSIVPDGEAVDAEARREWERLQQQTSHLLKALDTLCVPGTKLVDVQANSPSQGQTVGQIVSGPVPGTNVVLAMMRLESVGLRLGHVWSHTNKIRLVPPRPQGDGADQHGDEDDRHTVADEADGQHLAGSSIQEFRYLPYLPLWWPELDPETGKAYPPRHEEEDDDDVVENEHPEAYVPPDSPGSGPGR